MAQTPTNALAIALIQPQLPRGTTKAVSDYLQAQQTMLQTMYNALVQNFASKTLVGLAADRPAFGTPGRIFVATDTQVLYFDTGSEWLSAALT